MDGNLYSLNKLKSDIESSKIISFLLPKDKRDKLKKLERQLDLMEKSITLFNDYFSDMGWCAYDSMSMSLMQKAISEYESSGAGAGERVLLNYYKEGVKEIIHWLKNKAEPFSQRYELIQKAFDDHFAGRYYASVPLFLIIIDGAVNDYTKSKGFFAEGTDVTAWDCLVGCSDGLSKLKGIFNKGRNKTTQEEIRLPYRNGILHGRDLNYGNEFVSCKCVALMFALADWMNMRSSEEERKKKFEKDSNPPPISESLKKLKENALAREEIGHWQRRTVIVGTDIPAVPAIEDCVEYQYVIPLVKAFEAWNSKTMECFLYILNDCSVTKNQKRSVQVSADKCFRRKPFAHLKSRRLKNELVL